jgi:mevalonate kinase
MVLGAGRAPGKVILFGEHAVVYGRPALAVPVTHVEAEAVVELAARGAGLTILAEDLRTQIRLRDAAADQPLAATVRLALARLGLSEPDWLITVRSTIPIASGMGSGAAVSTAIVRGIADAARNTCPTPQALGMPPADISALVYEIEKLYHGTPSGIDNTVIVYSQPVYFVRGQPPQPFAIGKPFALVIADTGIRSPTRVTVGDVRLAWQAHTAHYEELFDRVAAVVEAARAAISEGRPEELGPLMDRNHTLLQEIDVSSPELDSLVTAARSAGALGAKLSGGGRGGNMIALATRETAPAVGEVLQAAGAVRVIVTQVLPA